MKLHFFKKIYYLYLIPLFAALVFVLVFTSCSSKNKEETKGTLTEDMITLTGKFYYTGSEIIPSDSNFTITYNEKTIGSRAFEYEAWDNIEPGTAYVRITAREDNSYLTGSVVLSFEILPGTGAKEVSTLEEIEVYAFNGCTSLSTKYYNGSSADFGKIIIGRDNDEIRSAKLVCKA